MSHITDDEVQELRDLIAKVEGWIQAKVAEQEEADPTEDAIFYSYEVVSEMKPVTVMFEKLLRKPKPVPPKPDSTNKTDSEGEGDEPETVFIDLNAGKDEEAGSDQEKKEEDVDRSERSEEPQSDSATSTAEGEL